MNLRYLFASTKLIQRSYYKTIYTTIKNIDTKNERLISVITKIIIDYTILLNIHKKWFNVGQ